MSEICCAIGGLQSHFPMGREGKVGGGSRRPQLGLSVNFSSLTFSSSKSPWSP